MPTRLVVFESLLTLGTEFAVDLHSKLPSLSDATTTGLLLADVSHHIDAIISFSQKNTVKLPPKTAKELERHGRDLWNLCVRLKRDKDDATVPQEEKRLVVRTRVFGFHILSLGRKGGREKKDVELEIAYLINLALMVGRVCVADSDLEAARTVLQKAAELVEQLKSLPTAQPRDDIGQRMRLEAEYLALRTALVGNISPALASLTDLRRVVEREQTRCGGAHVRQDRSPSTELGRGIGGKNGRYSSPHRARLIIQGRSFYGRQMAEACQ